MPHLLRTVTAAAAALLIAGCAHDSLTANMDGDLASLALDASASEVAGQASLPGFIMSADPTFQGTMGPADHCTWSPASARLECDPVTRGGLTITRSIAFYNAAGAAQPRRDSTTRSANTRVSVKGTTTTAKGSLTVDRASSVTVSGLGERVATHTLNGTEDGTTSGTVSTDRGTATIAESFRSTTANVVVPAPFSSTSWPTSGTTARVASETVTRGTETRAFTVGETVTYNGTSVVPVVVTRDGTTRRCTRDLATHRTTCS
jgi:hypothetical protein